MRQMLGAPLNDFRHLARSARHRSGQQLRARGRRRRFTRRSHGHLPLHALPIGVPRRRHFRLRLWHASRGRESQTPASRTSRRAADSRRSAAPTARRTRSSGAPRRAGSIHHREVRAGTTTTSRPRCVGTCLRRSSTAPWSGTSSTRTPSPTARTPEPHHRDAHLHAALRHAHGAGVGLRRRRQALSRRRWAHDGAGGSAQCVASARPRRSRSSSAREDSHGANPSHPPRSGSRTPASIGSGYAWVLYWVYGGDAPSAGSSRCNLDRCSATSPGAPPRPVERSAPVCASGAMSPCDSPS